MVVDARQRTKTNWIDARVRTSQLTRDDDSTLLNWACIFNDPNYPLELEFSAVNGPVDLLFVVCQPRSTLLRDHDQEIYGYEEEVPIEIYAIDKTGITGTKAVWKAEAELRYVAENYREGSQRDLSEGVDNTQNLGTTILHSRRFVLSYRRDTT